MYLKVKECVVKECWKSYSTYGEYLLKLSKHRVKGCTIKLCQLSWKSEVYWNIVCFTSLDISLAYFDTWCHKLKPFRFRISVILRACFDLKYISIVLEKHESSRDNKESMVKQLELEQQFCELRTIVSLEGN